MAKNAKVLPGSFIPRPEEKSTQLKRPAFQPEIVEELAKYQEEKPMLLGARRFETSTPALHDLQKRKT